MHIGHGNVDEEYKMGGDVRDRKNYLGVIFSVDVNVSEQRWIASSKAIKF